MKKLGRLNPGVKDNDRFVKVKKVEKLLDSLERMVLIRRVTTAFSYKQTQVFQKNILKVNNRYIVLGPNHKIHSGSSKGQLIH